MTTRLTTFEAIENAESALGSIIRSFGLEAGSTEDGQRIMRECGIDPDGFNAYIAAYARSALRVAMAAALSPSVITLASHIAAAHMSGVMAGAKAARATAESEAVGL